MNDMEYNFSYTCYYSSLVSMGTFTVYWRNKLMRLYIHIENEQIIIFMGFLYILILGYFLHNNIFFLMGLFSLLFLFMKILYNFNK